MSDEYERKFGMAGIWCWRFRFLHGRGSSTRIAIEQIFFN